ncbi:hypothetical protein [Chitinibacter sp. ZOR0017]|uniref:hypothetical protein n=1 Tax=Chitinibacter sp. ZOR0017 TaxID=1339254 RepID=UPI000647D235|nr:hypothetical protein [Chitinibacter sp. ZOR0017]
MGIASKAFIDNALLAIHLLGILKRSFGCAFFLAPTSRLLQRAKRHALGYKEHSSHRLAAHAYNLAIPLYIQNC